MVLRIRLLVELEHGFVMNHAVHNHTPTTKLQKMHSNRQAVRLLKNDNISCIHSLTHIHTLSLTHSP